MVQAMVILENIQTWSYKIPALPRAPLVAQTVKNPPAMPENPGLIPRWGRSPGEGNGNPLQCSCLENFLDKTA